MSNVYCIKPLHKKSVYWRVEMYRENPDGTTSWFNMEELFRWGQGFVEEEIDLPYKDTNLAYCKTNIGWGTEFDDSINVDWEFSDDITEEEQERIKSCYFDGDEDDEYERGGAAWLHEGNHDWQFEDEYVMIAAPFEIDYTDDYGTIIKENIELKERPPLNPNAAWPFGPSSTANIFNSIEETDK